MNGENPADEVELRPSGFVISVRDPSRAADNPPTDARLPQVVQGTAAPEFLDSYDDERQFAADENILNSARATNFMTPKSPRTKPSARASNVLQRPSGAIMPQLEKQRKASGRSRIFTPPASARSLSPDRKLWQAR